MARTWASSSRRKNRAYAKFVAHNLCVLISEMYTLGIEAIFPAAANVGRLTADEPNIIRFPTRL